MGFREAEALLLTLVLGLCVTQLEAQLQVGFYRNSCPNAEKIVTEEVVKALVTHPGVPADLLRLHFHDCFVRGCDGSVLLDSTPGSTAEKDSPINNSLEGYDVVDNAKTRLEAVCPGIVSCADIVAFAARDSVKLSKGIPYDVPAGRRDGRVSLSSETFTNLPPPTFNLDQLTQNFASKGLTQEDMVILSGAHTIGDARCSSITSRLYNFNSTGKADPSLDPAYAAKLKKKCPPTSVNGNRGVDMDPPSPTIIDSSYYRNLLFHRGLFTSDQTLMSSPVTAAQVMKNAFNDFLFNRNFAAAMVKMGRVEVLTGTNGEIRKKCNVIN
ncbi:unnamed protein product [Spirodela intermedia]|uniref:Peroxidase n=1 Tax=Spirodela intermedia TaxID=51605 RepID=A0A7I8K372_SPIIN|nr:unnamed protein product [Spirodela intermedia]